MLDRLHGPAGLYIGSKTPAEIALSIMAEVVAAKNGIQRAASVPAATGKARREPPRIEWGIVGRLPPERKPCLCCDPWSR